MIKVLIVDDEYIMRQGLRYMIDWEKEGYEIVGEAANGKEALELVEQLQPHIIICDIVMPMLDGVDFAGIIHKMYPQIQTIILSGYDKFEYVKQTLMSGVTDYILKPTLNQEELLNALNKAAEKIPGYVLQKERKNSYRRMLERYILGHDTEVNIEEWKHHFKNDYFQLYAVNINKEDSKGNDLAGLLYKKIERELVQTEEIQTVLFMLNEAYACVLFCYAFNQNQKVIKKAKEISDKISYLYPSVLGICSKRFEDIREIKERYQKDIIPYVDKKFYYADMNFLHINALNAPAKGEKIEKFDFMKYTYFLQNKQYGEAVHILRKYHQEALEKEMDEYRLKNQLKNMIYYYLDTLVIADEEKENYRYEYFKKIKEADTAERYTEYVDQILSELPKLAQGQNQQNDDRIHDILEYIDSHYNEELKLENLAERFNFNYSYLSAYFNQQVNEGFNDYLNRIRINKACELLSENKGSIAQISRAVGYSEHSYFCRVFKKITGKTPSAWRRS